jgi:hypothetical protein
VTAESGITHEQGNFSDPAIRSITQYKMTGGAVAPDYDRDGFLNIHVNEWRSDYQNPTPALPNTRLSRNRGTEAPGHFENVTKSAGVMMTLGAPAHQLAGLAFTSRFLDLDGDGWQDLMVTSDGGTSRLYWNNGDGTFLDGTEAANVGIDEFGIMWDRITLG